MSPGKSAAAARVAEGTVLPLELRGQHRLGRWEEPLLRRRLREGTGWRMPAVANDGQDKPHPSAQALLSHAEPQQKIPCACTARSIAGTVLQRAFEEFARNMGAAGVDGQTIADIQRASAAEFLTLLEAELRAPTGPAGQAGRDPKGVWWRAQCDDPGLARRQASTSIPSSRARASCAPGPAEGDYEVVGLADHRPMAWHSSKRLGGRAR